MNLLTGSALVSRDTTLTLLIVGGWVWWVWQDERRWFLRTLACIVCAGGIGYTLWWRLQTSEEWKVNLVFLMLLLTFMLSSIVYDEWKARSILRWGQAFRRRK